MNLVPGIPVASGVLSNHAAVIGATVSEPGNMAIILGSDFFHMILSKKEYRVPGMCGMVEDGVVPGLFAYEACQAGGSDHFSWFLDNAVPESYAKEARQKNVSLSQLMEEKAAALKPAESGLVALDWWAGNRSILVDKELTGLILGYSLETKPEEVYRTILEATAFGTRKIFETFIASGVPINEIIVAGGESTSNKLLLNILANVTRTEMKVAKSENPAALGAAIYGATAAGESSGGYGTIQEACKKMANLSSKSYVPNNNDKKTYNRLYSEYTLLHDYFGYGHNNAMKRLNNLRTNILEKKKR
jgi:L-ribulokinase